MQAILPGLVVPVMAPSRASPLPQVSVVYTNLVLDTEHCGSGLAREEAGMGNP
jgi:hypothetical protein